MANLKQSRLGHSNVSTTLGIYADCVEELNWRNTGIIESILSLGGGGA